MVFSSILFLFRFLPIFLICYYLVPGRMKNVILLLGSLIFYAWGEPVYVLLMLFSTVVDYTHGMLVEHYRGRKGAKIALVSSVIINLLVLGFFQYADFLIQSINSLLGTSLPLLNLPLPIGISFYTFQTMSYTIDVYRGEAKAQRNFLDFAVFVTMFPRLLAGPIVKYRDVQEEIHSRTLDLYAASHGVKRFCFGMAKKVLIANNIGELWDMICAMNFQEMSVLTAWLGIFAFAFRIYFDFSGYSDMAIGLGEMMGFHFPENFNYPYISASVTDFWRRWHMTLGTWFREYVCIPLGGNRRGMLGQLFNIFIVWILTGIWHGAGWNFLLWGLWYAFLLILEKLFLGRVLRFLPRAIGRLYTILVILVGWVMFALLTPAEILSYLKAMVGIAGGLTDNQGLCLWSEYRRTFLVAAVCSTPILAGIAKKLEKSGTGFGISLYRFGEKMIPAALLLLSIAGIVAA